MSGELTFECDVHFGKGPRGKKRVSTGMATAAPHTGRLPRVTKPMALAIRFDQLIRDGVVTDYAELARLGHVSRARVTQIMNLLNLAPDIQEWLLFLPPVERGRDPVGERELRSLVTETVWAKQRRTLN